MKKSLIFLFVIVFCVTIISCKKDEEVKPAAVPVKGHCKCIQDTCRVTLTQALTKDYPADSCRNIIITDLANYLPSTELF